MRVAVGFREKTKSEVIRGINKVRLAYSQFGDELVALGILPNKDLMYHLAHHELEQIIKKRNPLIISKYFLLLISNSNTLNHATFSGLWEDKGCIRSGTS